MISKKCTFKKYAFLLVLLLLAFTANITFAQGPKKTTSKESTTKAAAKGTLAADMDCSVTINKSAKVISVKAYTPIDVPINIGDNAIEATSIDKKATFRTNVKAKAGETVIVEISFFDDSKFLDYVKQGNVDMAAIAIKKNPKLATNEDESLTTSPLETAIVNSQPDMVTFLMSKGASFTTPEKIFPLHKAILHASSIKPGKDKTAPDRLLVDLFLSKGCKVTDKDDGGNTPLHCAVRAGKMDIVAFLIEKGADVNAKNDEGDTPLTIAEDKGEVSIIDYLKSKGAEEK